MFKWILFLVLGLTGCYSPGEEIDMAGKAQYGKSGGWSGGGRLTNDGVSNVGMAADFLAGREHNETPAKNYTVQFSVTAPISTISGLSVQTIINPIAEISWSVEGNTNRRVVSVTNGMSVTGVGQGVKVVVRDRTFQAANPSPATYEVTISVAPGSRPSENQPASLNPLLATNLNGIVVTAGNTTLIQVPKNSGILSAYVTANAGGIALAPFNAVVSFLDGNSNVQQVYDPVAHQDFVPLTPQTDTISFQNNTGPFSIEFFITFGIDG